MPTKEEILEKLKKMPKADLILALKYIKENGTTQETKAKKKTTSKKKKTTSKKKKSTSKKTTKKNHTRKKARAKKTTGIPLVVISAGYDEDNNKVRQIVPGKTRNEIKIEIEKMLNKAGIDAEVTFGGRKTADILVIADKSASASKSKENSTAEVVKISNFLSNGINIIKNLKLNEK